MVVINKSKSHPDLLVYASPRWNDDSDDSAAESDSESSLVDVTSRIPKTVQSSSATTADLSAIGSLLWHLLLTKKLPVQVEDTRSIWHDLQKDYPILAKFSLRDLQEYHTALTSIIILDPTIDRRATALLNDFNGHLVDVARPLTHELLHQSPDRFTALVADFNDNLAYQMQSTRGIPRTSTTMPCDEWTQQVAHLESTIQSALNSPQTELQASFLKTEHQTIPQPAHVDYPWTTLDERSHNLWLAFFPLTDQGMILQLWRSADGGPGQLVYVPLDKMLMVPSDTIHGGGFRTAGGNLRYHLYIATQGTALPQFAQNVYTLPHDRRHELGDVCVHAPGLDNGLLMQLLLD